MIIYQIKLPKTKSADDFIRFMKEEYLPSIHKGSTRIGQVTSLSLLQNGEGSSHEFLWQVGWSGLSGHDLRIDDEKVEKKFAGFGVKVKRLGDFGEVASWTEKEK